MAVSMSVGEMPKRAAVSEVAFEHFAKVHETAARLGYDGIEVMVYTDPVSQNVDVLRRLSDYHQIPVLAVHAPSLLLTQRVWGRDAWAKLRKSKDAAERLGARVVVLHPPFRWQREYARGFAIGVAELEAEFGVRVAVENMYPWRARGRCPTGWTSRADRRRSRRCAGPPRPGWP